MKASCRSGANKVSADLEKLRCRHDVAGMDEIMRVETAETQWEDILLICRKCSKRAGGGFGAKGRTRLDKILREELELGKGRKARIGVVMAPCFKVCPKHGITVACGSRPDTLQVVPHGVAAQDVAELLGVAAAKPKSETFIDWPFVGKRSVA